MSNLSTSNIESALRLITELAAKGQEQVHVDRAIHEIATALSELAAAQANTHHVITARRQPDGSMTMTVRRVPNMPRAQVGTVVQP